MLTTALSSWRFVPVWALLVLSSSAYGLGLGDVDLDSALNERLVARIQLNDTAGMDTSEVLVSLASSEDFERVGVERFFYLTDLRFNVVSDGRGLTIELSSSRPISEPYLNFLVEVLWPGGKLLKEYTLLLDPPTYSHAAVAPVTAPSTAEQDRQTAGRIERPAPESAPSRTTRRTSSTGTQVAMNEDARSSEDRFRAGANEYMTTRDDTLWKIAKRNLPSEQVTVNQNMLAIQRMNPDAFMRDNINLMKAGHVLRLPDEDDALAMNRPQANAEVAKQTDDWRAFRRGETPSERQPGELVAESGEVELRGQVNATRRADEPERPSEQTGGQLRIVAADGDSVTGREADGEALDAAEEENDRLNREVDELTYQLDREKEIATNEIQVKDRQIAMQDQQIAELQQQLRNMKDQLDDMGDAPSQNQSTQADAPWWASGYLVAGLAGALVLSLAGAMVAARRRRDDGDEDFDARFELPEPTAPAYPPAESKLQVHEVEEAPENDLVVGGLSAVDELEDEEESIAEAIPYTPDTPAETESDSGVSQTGDVIGEADIYIAYGRYPPSCGVAAWCVGRRYRERRRPGQTARGLC